jgi:hypothetical protein
VSPDAQSAPLSLLAAADDNVGYVVVRRIEETAQADDGALTSFRRAGVTVGAVVKCRRSDDRILVGSGGEYTEVSEATAAHVWVSPSREPQGEDTHATR